MLETPENVRSRNKTKFKRREKSYHTSRQNHNVIYQKNSTSIDDKKSKTSRADRRKKKTLHNGKSLHHIKRRRVTAVGDEAQGMPNLSFRNPNPPQNVTSNYSNKMPTEFVAPQRKTFDHSKPFKGMVKLFAEKGRSHRAFNQSSTSGGFGQNFMDQIPMNQSVVIGNQRRRQHDDSRLTMTSNNSLQRKTFSNSNQHRFQNISSRKLVTKKSKKKREKKLKTTSLRYKNKEIDIYSFKKVYKNMTNDYPNLEVINFQNNNFKGNIANIINDVIPKRRVYPMTLDLRNNFFVNMNERELQNLKEICRLKNVVVLL